MDYLNKSHLIIARGAVYLTLMRLAASHALRPLSVVFLLIGFALIVFFWTTILAVLLLVIKLLALMLVVLGVGFVVLLVIDATG